MTNPRIFGLALLILAGLAAGASAESIYEMALPGEPMLALDAHSLSLGGAADARWDLESGLPANPAQLLGLDGVTFAMVLQLSRARRDFEGTIWDETRQNFPAFQISTSLPGGLRLGAGYRADLRARGSFSQTHQVLTGDPDEIIRYDLHFEQEGIQNRFPIDLAVGVGSQLRLGAGLMLHKGKLEQEWIYDFGNDLYSDPDFEYQDRRVRRQAEWHGTGFIVGVQGKATDWLSASAYWESPADLNGEEIVEAAGEEELETRSLDGRTAARWTGALALYPHPGIVVSAQWDREEWGAYESPVGTENLGDVNRFGLGLEWTRESERLDRRRRRPFPLRLGLRLGELPRPDPLTGGQVSERLLALGTGIEVQEGRGSLDLTLYWQQYIVDDGEDESRWGLALSLRTSEIWKKRTVPF